MEYIEKKEAANLDLVESFVFIDKLKKGKFSSEKPLTFFFPTIVSINSSNLDS